MLSRALATMKSFIRPHGVFVVLLGPDGCGKSTLNECIEEASEGVFSQVWRFHWRPGLLPKLSSNNSSTKNEDDQIPLAPPTESSYRGMISIIRYLYYWVDFILGYWLIIYPKKVTNTLIVGERYAIDNAVNPERYGFDIPQRLMSLTTWLIPSPDLIIRLEGDAQAIHDRKPELEVHQIEALIHKYRLETARWLGSKTLALDTCLGVEKTAFSTMSAINNMAAVKPLSGYKVFPPFGNAKIAVSPGSTVAQALNMYNPGGKYGRAAKKFFQCLPDCIAKLLLPKARGPVLVKLKTIESYVDDLVCRFSSNVLINICIGTPGTDSKFTAQITSQEQVLAYAKIATNDRTESLIANERLSLKLLKGLGTGNVCVPEIMLDDVEAEAMLIQSAPTEAFKTIPLGFDNIDCELPITLSAIASSRQTVAAFYATHDLENEVNQLCKDAYPVLAALFENCGIACSFGHGDYAPWNTLRLLRNRIWLFDWEYASAEYPALFDLIHYGYIQNYLLTSLSPAENCRQIISLISSSRFAKVRDVFSIEDQAIPGYLLLYLLIMLRRLPSSGKEYVKDSISAILEQL